MNIGIIVFHGNTSLSFTILNIISFLAEHHCVHLFRNRRQNWRNVPQTGLDPRAIVHDFDTQTQLYTYSWKNLIDIVRLARFVCSQAHTYDVLIGVDQDAVIAAMLVKLRGSAKKLIYLSTEIILYADYAHKGLYFFIKHWLEKWALRCSVQLWIQDRFRGRALVEDLGFPEYPFTILPHAPRGFNRFSSKPTYLRKKYAFSAETKVMVYAGGIDPVYHSLDIGKMAACSATWPENLILVMHGFGQENSLAYLHELQNSRFILSKDLLAFEELEELIASADIGVALFDPTIDTNHRLMTSGKIMSYLKAGIPVITTSTPTTEDVVTRHHAGICIQNLNKLPGAYHQIMGDYKTYAANAAHAFAAEYEFDQNFHVAWMRLMNHFSESYLP
jgi:hypothetical protein